MNAVRYKVIVVEQDVEIRTKICTWLAQEGYSVFECKDAYKTLRLARQVLPHLVLLDSGIRGINSKQLMNIIESDQLSRVVLMTDHENDEFYHLLSSSELKVFIRKPLDRSLFIKLMRQTIERLNDATKLKLQNERKNREASKAVAIDQVKSFVMDKWHLTEDQAYTYMRRMSMDQSISMEALSKAIIKKYKLS